MFVLVVVLLAGVAACGRSGEEITRLRQAVEAEMAKAPLPPGARLLTERGRFDKGCHDFWECADGPDRPAVYEADLYLGRPPADLASMCAYFVAMLRGAGFRLAGSWERTPFEIGEAACAAGHPGAGTVVRQDGTSFSDNATLEFSLLDGDTVAPRYKLIYEPHEPVRLTEVRLTRSMVAHLRKELDREFVLAAAPEADGITTGDLKGQQWTVPPDVTSLRFEITCDEQDEVEVQAKDPSSPDSGRRTVQCTGAATAVDMPVSLKRDKVFVVFTVYGRSATPGAQPHRNGDYLVRFVSRS
ncbi:hypothetical protein FXN61_08230 [Lentzea sp. PSKA42]|uniref:Uncharacterized protein n=1 Tax=Lentzea indica TaxID=2604800 RepID=A0ABX1FDG2_9PSEU|nr:hypothetical protein [Lentzea indica]NKE56824.1 hypothetical protein [Lentzea indica]